MCKNQSSHVDCSGRAQQAIYLRRSRAADSRHRTAHDRAHADRHLSEHRHPCRLRHLELWRPVGAGDGRPDRLELRAVADDRGQRHRARRVAVAARHRRSSRSSCSRARTSTSPSRRSTAVSQAMLRQAPAGTSRRSSSRTTRRACRSSSWRCRASGLSEQQLFDLGVNFLRPQLATVPGAAIPYPYGGKQPQIQVDLDPRGAAGASTSRRPTSSTRSAQQNLILPVGHVEDRIDRVRRRPERAARRRSTS